MYTNELLLTAQRAEEKLIKAQKNAKVVDFSIICLAVESRQRWYEAAKRDAGI